MVAHITFWEKKFFQQQKDFVNYVNVWWIREVVE